MIQTRFYLDCRVAQGEAPLKLAIHKRGAGAFLSTGIRLLPSQWDGKAQKVLAHPHKAALNAFLTGFKFKVDNFIRDIVLDGTAANLTATQIKCLCAEQFDGRRDTETLRDYWFRVCANLSQSSQVIYHTSWRQVALYDQSADTRLLASVNRKWIDGYVDWLQGQPELKNNTRSTYLAKLKAVLASAVKDGLIQSDPSSSVSIAFTPSKRRNLSATQMHTMLSVPAADDNEQLAVDLFALSFFLRAANPADIVRFTTDDIFNGRLEYNRAKTGKHYSVRIEPEAQSVIDRYTDGHLLFVIPPRFKNYASFLATIDKLLTRRSASLGLPPCTIYWARHSFASIAFELGYGMDLVSASLGHSMGGAPITSVYVAVQDRQVDDLARAVYDAVRAAG